jgi:hypothetical protein
MLAAAKNALEATPVAPPYRGVQNPSRIHGFPLRVRPCDRRMASHLLRALVSTTTVFWLHAIALDGGTSALSAQAADNGPTKQLPSPQSAKPFGVSPRSVLVSPMTASHIHHPVVRLQETPLANVRPFPTPDLISVLVRMLPQPVLSR